jgi:hypothetical protein
VAPESDTRRCLTMCDLLCVSTHAKSVQQCLLQGDALHEKFSESGALDNGLGRWLL